MKGNLILSLIFAFLLANGEVSAFFGKQQIVLDLFFDNFIQKNVVENNWGNSEFDVERLDVYKLIYEGFPDIKIQGLSCKTLKSFKFGKTYSLEQRFNYYFLSDSIGCSNIQPELKTRKKIDNMNKEDYVKSYYQLY